jgi:hypothetical protein
MAASEDLLVLYGMPARINVKAPRLLEEDGQPRRVLNARADWADYQSAYTVYRLLIHPFLLLPTADLTVVPWPRTIKLSATRVGNPTSDWCSMLLGARASLVFGNRPGAAEATVEQPEHIQWLELVKQIEDDLIDLTLVAARVLTDSGERISLDELLARFGYTREQLRAIADPE